MRTEQVRSRQRSPVGTATHLPSLSTIQQRPQAGGTLTTAVWWRGELGACAAVAAGCTTALYLYFGGRAETPTATSHSTYRLRSGAIQ